MNKNTIEYLAYKLKSCRESKERAVVFIGAGVSASAGIPLATQIVNDIKEKFKENPLIKDCIDKNENDYYKIMGKLDSDERRELFYNYITSEKVKTNVSNIYLAQLLKENYVDFILTVNFDDIIIKACALFNFIPPIYDLSNVLMPTTSKYRNKSVIYLHGQHFGQWLLNDETEIEKPENEIRTLFSELKGRPWIVVGYSGNDGILKSIIELGEFSKDLFWINYKKHNIENDKLSKFLGDANSHAYQIDGYDSDSFFLKLHSELKMETPQIFDKPFSFLKEFTSNIKDIEEYESETEHKNMFDKVNQRLVITNKWIDEAIKNYENKESNEKLNQEIIEAAVKGDYEKIDYYYSLAQSNLYIKESVANLLILKGNTISNNIKKIYEIDEYNLALEYYNKADILKNRYILVYQNKSVLNFNIAINVYNKFKNEKLNYLESALNCINTCLEIDSSNNDIYITKACILANIGEFKNNEEFVNQSIEILDSLYSNDPNNIMIINNYIISYNILSEIYLNKNNKVKALNFSNSVMYYLSKNNNKDDVHFLYYAFSYFVKSRITNNVDDYKKTLEYINLIENKIPKIYSVWSTTLLFYFRILEGDSKIKVLNDAFNISLQEYKLTTNPYNLACCYALKNEKNSALKYLEEAFENSQINVKHINEDKDWDNFRDDEKFKSIIDKYIL